MIRERAGATLLGNVAETTMEIVRTERRKELGFENKTWWDMKRWRTLDREQNNRIYRILMPFYADKAGKWFFDARYDEKEYPLYSGFPLVLFGYTSEYNQ